MTLKEARLALGWSAKRTGAFFGCAMSAWYQRENRNWVPTEHKLLAMEFVRTAQLVKELTDRLEQWSLSPDRSKP